MSEDAWARQQRLRADLAAAQKRIAELEKEAEYRRNVAREDDALYRQRMERIAELEAQVAQHPEQLRRVAEAVQLALIPRFPCEWQPPTNTCLGCAIRSELRPPPRLDAIIAEATKPEPSAPTDGGSAP